jgi:hypothetical protein
MLETLSDLMYMHWLARLVDQYSWFWPVCEMLHFVGLAMLVGVTGLFDLRLLGFAKDVPAGSLHRLIPWALVGFGICAATGAVFVGGNAFEQPISLFRNVAFQLKMLFIALAGLNALLFYVTPLHRAVQAVGPGDKAPLGAQVIAATSLLLWIGVMYMGRMIPWEDALLSAIGR